MVKWTTLLCAITGITGQGRICDTKNVQKMKQKFKKKNPKKIEPRTSNQLDRKGDPEGFMVDLSFSSYFL